MTARRKARPGSAVALALALALALAACGKKGDPEPPEDAENVYPRTYPAPPPR